MATSVWKGHLTFGLVSIPIKLYRAARAEKVSFRQLHRTVAPASSAVKEAARPAALEISSGIRPPGPVRVPPVPMPVVESVSRVRQSMVTEDEDVAVDRSQLVKGYEYEKDKYVLIEKEELAALTPETNPVMEISEFVKLEEIDPVYFETSYYVAPEKAGMKPYSLLFEALRQSGYVAIAEFAMQRRNHVVLLRTGKRGILLHTMFYSTEIRGEDEFAADKSLISGPEIEMGKTLIAAMAAEFAPEKFHDTYKEQLEALIQAKVEGRSVAVAEKPKTAVAGDILKALQNSLELVKKPVASAGGAGATKVNRTRPT